MHYTTSYTTGERETRDDYAMTDLEGALENLIHAIMHYTEPSAKNPPISDRALALAPSARHWLGVLNNWQRPARPSKRERSCDY